MKKKLVFSAIYFLLLSQIYLAQPSFECRYITGKETSVNCVLELPDDKLYIIGGYTKGTLSDKNFYLLAFDNLGTVKWKKALGKNFYTEEIVDMVQAPDGGFLALGYRFQVGGVSRENVLIKLKSNGDVEWMKYYQSLILTESTFASKLLQVDDKYVIMSYGSDFNSLVSIDMMETDLSGSVTNKKRINSKEDIVPADIIFNKEKHEFVILAVESNDLVDEINGVLLSLDNNFDLVAYKKWPYPLKFGAPRSLCESVNSSTEYITYGDVRNKLLTINSTFANAGDFNITTNTFIHYTFIDKSYASHGIQIDKAHNSSHGFAYFALSFYEIPGSHSRPVMQILDDQGTEILVGEYGKNINANISLEPKCAIKTSDGGYLIIAHYSGVSVSDPYVIKTDQNLRTNCNDYPVSFKDKQDYTDREIDLSTDGIEYNDVGYGQEFSSGIEFNFFCKAIGKEAVGISKLNIRENINVYPNPSSDLLTINCNSLEGKIKVRLVNIIGSETRTIFNGSVPENKEIITDVQNVPSGNYILVVESGNEILKKNLVTISH